MTQLPAKRKSLEPEVYQQIIRFSKLAKGMDESERTKLEVRIARYSNFIVKASAKVSRSMNDPPAICGFSFRNFVTISGSRTRTGHCFTGRSAGLWGGF